MIGIVIPMDVLRRQIFELDRKVEQLNQVVDRLSTQITALALEKQPNTSGTLAHAAHLPSVRTSNLTFEHKDILVDGDGWNHSQQNEQNLSPEIQIRRLTAQLTAAYNRIAVLEEQLLACRINS